MPLIPVFDLDGTLIDSDAALVAPFLALGITEDQVSFGHVLEHECARLNITVADYLRHYDVTMAMPFTGVAEMVDALDVWAVCSNKDGESARAELLRLGWQPDVALFADDFGGPKQLQPVLDALAVRAQDVVFIGDTEHDRRCATAIGCTFALATWNPRASAVAGDVVLRRSADVFDLLRRGFLN